MTHDVVIVGAGLAGLRAAAVLARRGLDVSVLDADVLPRIAKRSDALLHVVAAPIWTGGSPNRGRLTLSGRTLPFVEAAELTGGAAHTIGKVLIGAFKVVIDDFHSSYLLRYTPRGVTLAGWHEISVRMRSAQASKYAIRARKGYFGG